MNRSLLSLKSLSFFFHATNTIILSFLPIYLQDKGLNGAEIGWVLAIGPFASIFSQPFWGYLSDKYQTVKTMLLISVLGMLLVSIVFFQMNQLLGILILGAIFYFFSSPVGALSDSLAQRRANELQISFGSIRTWGSIGFAFSSLIVGEFLSKIGIQYILWPYLFFGTILLIISFLIEDVTADNETVRLSDVKNLILYLPYSLFLGVILFITITHRANDSFIGIYLSELGGAEDIVGLAWFVGVISEAIVFALAFIWFRAWHPLVYLIIASSLYAARWIIYSMVDSPQTIILFQVLHGATFGVFYVASFDFITRLIPKSLLATGHLIFYSVFFGISGIIGSLAGGFLIELYDGASLYRWMGVSAGIGIILFFFYAIWFKRYTNRQSA